jgi:hypothetical protein
LVNISQLSITPKYLKGFTPPPDFHILASTKSSSAKESYNVCYWYCKVFSLSGFVPLDNNSRLSANLIILIEVVSFEAPDFVAITVCNVENPSGCDL